ncbi:head GIN domain-containing protein [Deminuibacter soli]|uniref:DUF2807 domain-containing protein n=1 Tax=Deminuibacter soli TaxID=2291815 RepID=A0A3E1NL23_9BACT|nr:head GIN domain-containing protein [Deminuibacter soli]RFM28639.1 DUF2807 domain-containing protein [Deminuibacter soli]
MNKLLLLACAAGFAFGSCRGFDQRQVKGNGNVTSETRTITSANDIEIYGDFTVDIIPDPSTTSLTLDADANLLPYIETGMDNGHLVIKTKEHTWLRPAGKMHVTIHTPKLESVDISGSTIVTGKGKFSGGNKLELDISGDGKINLEVNTPKVSGTISGSGDMNIAGETQNLDVDISGSGNFWGENLKSEDAKIEITGSGDAKVFADVQLKAGITGSGKILYRGNGNVSSEITGSGTVKKMEN